MLRNGVRVYRRYASTEATATAGASGPGHAHGRHSRATADVIRNEAGVQLLSRPLHRQIFGSKRLFARPTRESVDISRKHLAKHGLAGQANTEVPDIHFDLPPLQGDNLTEHFHNIAHEDCAADLVLADDYAKAVLPRFPEHWQRTSGWTCYEPDGSFHSVDHPPADVALTFDVETMYTHSPFAVLAIAATDKAWYGWVSPWLLGETEDKEQLIPMPARSIGATRRIVVGHAVSYDRARILDEYHLESSGNRFIDTMSLHIARRGLSSPQRPDFLRRKKFKEEQAKRAKAEGEEADEVEGEVGATVGEMTPRQLANTLSDLDDPDRPWYDVVTTNGLADVVNLHFNTKLSKEPRDLFGPGATRDGVLAEFHELMNYCATDVLYTHQVYRASFPDFRAACPAPASIAGILHMASALLPVDADWPRFIAAADAKFNEYQHNIEAALVELAEKERLRIHESPDADGKRSYDDDPWLRQLDWSAVKMPRNLVRPALAPAGGPAATADARPPRWTRALAPNDPSSGILLRLTCEGRPLRWRATTGWIAVSEDGTETLLLVDGAPLRRIFDQRGTLTLQRTPSTELADLVLRLALSGADALRVELKERSLDHKGKSGELLGRLLAAHGYDVDMSAWSLKVDELKVKLADLGLSRKGTKAELFARLVASSYLPVEKEVRSGKPASCVIKFMYVQTVGAPLHLSSPYPEVEAAFSSNSAEAITALEERVRTLAEAALERAGNAQADEHLSELDWSREAKASVVSEASEDTVCPQWYRSLVKKGELHLSLRTRLAPLLLRCSWTGHPLVHTTKHGWCFRKSQAGGSVVLDDDERLDFDGRDTHLVDDENECAVRYVKVPHPSGSPLKNVGNPLSKDFAKLIDSGVLTAELTTARDRLRDHIACSYWGSSQRRIKEQTVVYQRPGRDLGLPTVEGDRGPLGFIVPNVVPMGTVTRRAVESTWLTAANTKATRIGSEIKSLIRAPPGYAIVGADVDSEELWICSVIGDAQFGFHGATALGWQTLEGTKAAGTDMHSATAKTIGVSRDKAKVFNYSRLYGAGLRFAEQELRKADPQLTAEAARTKASALYAQTKGRQTSYWLERDEKRQKVRAWSGGSESLVFNALETVALSNEPRTLALGASITEALSQARLSQAEDTPDDEAAGRRSQPKLFMTSRINWSVQSSGVDYLHLLIVAIEHVCRHYGIKARYMLSLHDELRYLVKHEDRYRAALAMQVANLWVRAYFAYRLSMDDLPQSCAFFSAVDIDHVLRKETHDNCVTPSQPTPIAPGEALDISQILAQTGGSLRADGRGNRDDLCEPLTERVYVAERDDPPGARLRETNIRYLRHQALGSQERGQYGREA